MGRDSSKASAAWARVVEKATLGEAYHRQGIGRADDTMAEEVRAVVASTLARTPPPELDVAREAARLALLGPSVHYELPSLFAELVRFWTAAEGADFALAVALAAQDYERHTPDDYVNYGAWLSRRSKRAPLGWYYHALWPDLRRAYAEADQEERARAREIARGARSSADLALRAALAFVVFDDDALWTPDDRRAVVASSDVWSELPHFAVLAECRRSSIAFGDDSPDADVIAKALGPEAFVALQILYKHGPDPRVGEPLGALATPEALSALADPADRKDIGPTLEAGLRASPKAAIDGLAPRTLRGARPLHPFAHALLLSLVAEHPELAQKSSAPKQAIAALLAEAGADVPLADVSALPAALVSPPWKAPVSKAKKAPKKAPTALTELAFEERIDWGDSPPKVRENHHAWNEAELVARIEKREDEGTVFLSDFAWHGIFRTETVVRLLGTLEATQLYGNVDDIERMLLAYGLAVLEPLLAYVKRQPDRLDALRAVDSPRVASIAAHAFATSKKNKEAGKRWLEAHPRAAAVRLLPEWIASNGKARAPSEAALRHLATSHRTALDAIARAYGEGAVNALEEIAGSPSGPEIPKKLPKLPAFADPVRLPRPLLADRSRALSNEAIETLLHWLSISKRDAPQPALAEISAALDRRSLARFAFALFTGWVMAKGPPKEAWAMDALGFFGDAVVARDLVPLARTWAPGGLPQRAQSLVSVLAIMGNDAALLGIHRLTKVQSRALAAHAEKTLADVAAARGLGKDDLADRLVPDLGLDADGTKTFVTAGKRYVVRFDAELAPTLLADDGTELAELPKPKKDDDGEEAAFALAEWKELKKSAKRVAKEEVARLETAMSTQRRFSKEHFETFFARHPFVTHLARRLLWGVYAGASLEFAFRVGDDQSYVGQDDRELTLAEGARLGLVHPLELGEAAQKIWGDRFSDYELIQPFSQLGREVYALELKERKSQALTRYDGAIVPSGKVLGLERSGWKREAAGQGGMVAVFEKTFGDVRARLMVDPGVYLGDPKMHPEQTLQGVVFGRSEVMVLEEVPAVVFSEVVRDLSRMTG